MDRRKTVSNKAHFDIIVTPGFVLTELATCVDVLRIANRLSHNPPFSWAFRSATGGCLSSSSAAFVDTEPFEQSPQADYAIVIGNSDADHPALSLGPTLHRYTRRGTRVVLLAEAASRYIRDSNEDGHTTHWENTAMLRERSGLFEANHALATETDTVITCAGMLSTVDVTLTIAGRHVSSATIMTVADIMLHERIRDFGTLQPFSGAASTATGDAHLDECIELMQANIEEPIPIHQLVDTLGISTRSLERKFKTILGPTPAAYYKELRLRRANNLLLNTTMRMRDIGLACGFPNGFSSVYRDFFGVTPLELRKKRLGRT